VVRGERMRAAAHEIKLDQRFAAVLGPAESEVGGIVGPENNGFTIKDSGFDRQGRDGIPGCD
jgi:hypothetical protein